MSPVTYSLANYRLLVDRALNGGYAFVPFNLEEIPQQGSIYLRHDVDYSLPLALELAKVNAEMNVPGTFFVLLRSHAYNLLSASSQAIVKEIYELGQHVALHAVVDVSASDLIEKRLRSDFDFVRVNLPFISPVFSWHNPTAELLDQTRSFDEIAGLMNVYSNRFTAGLTYRSDSNMRHGPDEFLRLIDARPEHALQLLFHPLIWVLGGNNMTSVLAAVWPYLIKEQEKEMNQNNLYRNLLPEGMPDCLLMKFSESLLAKMISQ
ncbi:MAG: hypothetical protein ABR555_19445 [Pyrinomonadaceae bacterium]